ncbi:hypothetical protein KVR01_011111 [Diaporthe batatas]|uniref:uncharacterized protein n=1 Tax=Diaporthe batatas TaxID=748121 RepID=UPI001D058229|nr:uncharacterized protein KVR01_011111 [Diaporthe batatas]KAG8159450.1 hypothetical protein KVR01_011111 [Diaporthe batatas]
MTDLNIPAIAGAAFFGFLALAALLFLFAPVTRFLGDLFCCPWRVPFTRKRRRNGDEEMDKEDLTYLSGRRLESPIRDSTSNKSMPAGYVMGHGTCQHETAREIFWDGTRHTEGDQETDLGYDGGTYRGEYYGESYWRSYSDSQSPFPRSRGEEWWRSRTDEYPEFTERDTHKYHAGYHFSEEENYGYDKETFSGPEIQRPQPSYSPSEVVSDRYNANYFPWAQNEYFSQYR